MITLYFNDTSLDVHESEESYRYRSIMGEHSLTLKFSLPEYIEFPIGTWCEYMAVKYTLEVPANFKKHGNRNFEYTLLMQSVQVQLGRYKLRNTVDKRLKFSMCATPKEFLQTIVDNLNQRDSGWSVGDCIVSTEKTIPFDHSYIDAALQSVADTFNTEWEIVGKVIHLRKVEYFKDDPLPLSYGKGNGFVPGLGRSTESESRPIEIMFAQGGSKNIDRSKYGAPELLLPKSQTLEYEGRTYISDAEGYSIQRKDKPLKYKTEDSLDCSEIYPSRVGTVSKVEVIDEANNFYDIIDESIPANLDYNDYLIEGENMTIIFQSGMLAGNDKAFELKYKHAERRFEIVPQEIDGQTMPGGVYVPRVGDTYAIFGCMLPDAYVCDNASQTGASWDMFRETAKALYEKEDVKFTFTGELQGMWAKRNWLKVGGKLVVGGYVLFSDNQFAPEGIPIRITGIKDYPTSPYSPTIELSNDVQGKSLSSTIDEIQNGNVIVEDNDKEIIRFTKRRFRDAVETMKMLEDALLENFTSSITPITVQTMAMLVGDESLQFRFVDSSLRPIQYHITYNQETKQLIAPATILQHMTLGIDTITSDRSKTEYKHWNIKGYTSPVLDKLSQQYYFYAKVPTGTGEGEFVLSPTAISMDDVSGFYHLLVGLLNSEYDGERSFVTLYGFTEVLPGRITTDKIVSADGTTYFDLANSVIGGRIKFRSTNGTEKDLSEFEDDVNGNYADLKKNAVLKETIIEGGYLKNDLIDTNNLIVKNIYSKDGKFKTLEDGTIYGVDVNLEGTIKADDGTIGGFEIGQGRIGVAESGSMGGSYDGLSILSSFIKYSTQDLWTGFGTNVMPASSGMMGLCRLEYTGSRYTSGLGLYIKFRPRNYGNWWNPPKALNIDGNSYLKGGFCLFEDTYRGQAYTNIIEENIGVTHSYVFTSIGGSYVRVRLPTSSQIQSAAGTSQVTFLLHIQVGYLGNGNRISVQGQSGCYLCDNNANHPNGGYGSVDMAQGDSLLLRYNNGDYYMVIYGT